MSMTATRWGPLAAAGAGVGGCAGGCAGAWARAGAGEPSVQKTNRAIDVAATLDDICLSFVKPRRFGSRPD
jgi:hypothetical protein